MEKPGYIQMKINLLTLSIFCKLILFIFIIGCNQRPNNNSLNHSELKGNLDEYFTALYQMRTFNGIIHVSKDGHEIFNKAYNLDPDSSASTFVTKQNQFDIHSVSKLMAHYLILKLEKDGKVNRQDPLNNFITGFPRGDEITIEMLLNHSSGLPRELSGFEGNKIDLEPEDVLELASREDLLFEPGADIQYSNVGYLILYNILGNLAGTSFEQFLVDELFQPNGMNHSGAHFYTDQKNITNLVRKHEQKDSLIVPVDNVTESEYKLARVYSTVKNLDTFLRLLHRDPYSSALAGEDHTIQQSGGSDGIRVHVYTNVQTKNSFVLLANYDAIPFLKTIEDVASILEGKPYEIPKEVNRIPVTLSDETLSKYIGVYEFADMNHLLLELKIEDNHLSVYQDNEQIAILSAENDSVFFEHPQDTDVFKFIPNDHGSYDVIMGWRGVKLKGVKQMD